MLHWHVRKSNSGFTLIEMLVTVILIGIVAAISAPNLTALLNRNRSNQATRQIEGALVEAQKQAIRRGRSCKIGVSITATNSALVNPPPDPSDPFDPPGCLTTPRQLNTNVNLSTTLPTLPARGTVFSGKGNVTGTPILFVTSIANGNINQQRCVVIENALGKIRTGNYRIPLTNPLNVNECY